MGSFRELIEGHYRNQRQAMSNPAKWPQIDLRVTWVSDNVFESKSWYKYKGEENAYNHLKYVITKKTEAIIYTEVFSYISNKDTCPYYWWTDGKWWYGTTEGDCIVKDTKLISNVRFNGHDYRTLDTGLDLETGEFRWGKREDDGEFLFERLPK